MAARDGLTKRELLSKGTQLVWKPIIISAAIAAGFLFILIYFHVKVGKPSSDLFQIVLALATVSSIFIIPFGFQVIEYQKRQWDIWQAEKGPKIMKERAGMQRQRSEKVIHGSWVSFGLTSLSTIISFFSILWHVYLDAVLPLAFATIFCFILLIISLGYLVWSSNILI
jgi:hypothetical protein